MMIRNAHADHQFQWLRKEAGVLRFDSARYQPRLHDFRHTFAVTRLLTWYREGKDVKRMVPLLSTYLGHCRIDETSVYLKMKGVSSRVLRGLWYRVGNYRAGRRTEPRRVSIWSAASPATPRPFR